MFSNVFSLSVSRDDGNGNGFGLNHGLGPSGGESHTKPDGTESGGLLASFLASGPWLLPQLTQGLGADAAPSADELWEPEEYEEILLHLLSATLYEEFYDREQDPSTGFSGQSSSVSNLSSLRFADVFADPNPSLEWLKAIKEYAKNNRVGLRNQHNCLPSAVATVLYFAVIAKAISVGAESFTALKLSQLQEGFAWTLKTEWVPESLKSVVRQAVERLNGAEAEAEAEAAGVGGANAGEAVKIGGGIGDGVSGETASTGEEQEAGGGEGRL